MDLRRRPALLALLLRSAGIALLVASCSPGAEQRALPSSADRNTRSLARACDDGDTIACHNLAVSWHHGADGLAPSPSRAASLFARNCTAGESESCRHAARLALPGDPVSARTFLERACNAPDPFACHELAEHLLTGLDRGPEPVEAFALFERACASHAARACVSLARLMLDPDHPAHDDARGRLLLGRMCQEGQMSACMDGGLMLAEELRRRAGAPAAPSAEHEEPDVEPHHDDILLPADLTLDPAAATPEAVERLLRRGCLGGLGQSCAALAELLREGDLLPADPERAERLERMAREARR